MPELGDNSLSDQENILSVSSRRILLFHKSKGSVVTRSDEMGRRTVYDDLPSWLAEEGFMPVGRLDRDTRGLLLFTSDSRLMDRLTKPHQCEKMYDVWIRGQVTDKQMRMILNGIESQGEMLLAKGIIITGNAGPKTRLTVVLDEGKNRHIRRMFAALVDEKTGRPLKVTDLKRFRFGPIVLDIPSGSFRLLSPIEIRNLYKAAGLSR